MYYVDDDVADATCDGYDDGMMRADVSVILRRVVAIGMVRMTMMPILRTWMLIIMVMMVVLVMIMVTRVLMITLLKPKLIIVVSRMVMLMMVMLMMNYMGCCTNGDNVACVDVVAVGVDVVVADGVAVVTLWYLWCCV